MSPRPVLRRNRDSFVAILIVLATSTIALSLLSFGLSFRRFGLNRKTLEAGQPLAAILVCGVGSFVWLRWRKGFESPQEIVAELRPEGFKISVGDLAESKLSWASIGEIRPTRDHIIILVTALDTSNGRRVTSNVYPIPLRAFSTPEAHVSCRQLECGKPRLEQPRILAPNK